MSAGPDEPGDGVSADVKTSGTKKMQLKLDAETARGSYANATVVTHGRNEVVLDFVAALPHHRPQVVSRIVLPRSQAEALAGTLRRTLDATPPGGPTAPVARREDDDPN